MPNTDIHWIARSPDHCWSEKKAPTPLEWKGRTDLTFTGERRQIVEGFGGCFQP